MKNIILDSNDITNKIRRISFEIIEKNYDENEIFLVGILPNGKYLSNKITEFLNDFSEKNSNPKNQNFMLSAGATRSL